ncbi:MAG: hypothetical protein V7K14_03700 [Nostoc sp.]|uniref:hypothetical protein n=1 Tax=Nostoc sp. TaxID=1180 RepID=UPI002FFC0910
MNSQDFLEAGYRQYKETGFRAAEFLLQKRIFDVNGTKYFLNIYLYNLESKEVFDSEVRFTKNLKLYSITVSEFQSVEEIENIFEDLWERMCFDYQERTS